jgi:hypothetical protein
MALGSPAILSSTQLLKTSLNMGVLWVKLGSSLIRIQSVGDLVIT